MLCLKAKDFGRIKSSGEHYETHGAAPSCSPIPRYLSIPLCIEETVENTFYTFCNRSLDHLIDSALGVTQKKNQDNIHQSRLPNRPFSHTDRSLVAQCLSPSIRKKGLCVCDRKKQKDSATIDERRERNKVPLYVCLSVSRVRSMHDANGGLSQEEENQQRTQLSFCIRMVLFHPEKKRYDVIRMQRCSG